MLDSGANITKNRTPAMPIGRRFSTIFFALLAAAALCGGAAAQVTSGNAFTITGVDVDTTGPGDDMISHDSSADFHDRGGPITARCSCTERRIRMK